jgi:hypothetical protein
LGSGECRCGETVIKNMSCVGSSRQRVPAVGVFFVLHFGCFGFGSQCPPFLSASLVPGFRCSQLIWVGKNTHFPAPAPVYTRFLTSYSFSFCPSRGRLLLSGSLIALRRSGGSGGRISHRKRLLTALSLPPAKPAHHQPSVAYPAFVKLQHDGT